MLTRRHFIVGASAVVAPDLRHSRQAEAGPALRPLPIPNLVEPAKLGGQVKLTVDSGKHEFFEGKPTKTFGYSGQILGPTIRVRRGDMVQVAVENRLDRVTTTHWHGVLVPGQCDGGPHQMINPGSTWHPTLKIDQPAATAWYHPHPHNDTARQVYMGLSGIFIIEDDLSLSLDLPRTYGVDDLPIILQDRSFGSDGSLTYDPSPMEIVYGTRGDTIIVNGAVAPVAKVPGGLVRLRLLNGANARNFDLRFSDNRAFYVIASDAGFLPEPIPVTQLTISPGERFEMLVDFSDGQAVTFQTGPDAQIGGFDPLIEDPGELRDVPVIHFETFPTADAVRTLPKHLVELTSADPRMAVTRRQFVLDCDRPANYSHHGAAGMRMTINGRTHDLARIDATVKFGATEVWEIMSMRMAHAFHTHGASFRILSINDEDPPAHLKGWKDVVLVEDRAELLITFHQPAPRRHPFMFHCHVLEHEDAGLMGQYVCL